MIRLARTEDVSKLEACARAAYGLYLPRMDRPPAPLLADYAALVAAGEVHVLDDSGHLEGFIVLRPLGDRLFVENLAVDPTHQGRGLGRRLMAFAEFRAGDLGLPALRLYTNEVIHETIPFYQGLGFTVSEGVVENGYRRVYLEKRLV